MPNNDASKILLSQEQGIPRLQAFALANEIDTLGELLSFPMSALASMSGYSIQAQNEIIDLATKYGLLQALKQY